MSASEFSRRRALAILGENWILHPNYKFNPRHSHHPAIYLPAREKFLKQIAENARVSRERNFAALQKQIEEDHTAWNNAAAARCPEYSFIRLVRA